MRWFVVALLGIVGGYMLFDGIRALTVGDYLTPSSGAYSGQLGPWAGLVEAVGIDPRSTAMKVAFVTIGALHLAAAAGAIGSGAARASWLVVVAALSGLWYLPFGTAADGIALAVVAFSDLRPW